MEKTMQDAEGKKKEFMGRLRKAARLDALAWCPKHKACVVTLSLWALHCWECKRYVVNGGSCDPL